MGSCLSKKGTKGRDGDDPDKMPYTKAAGDSGKKGKKKGKQQQEVEPPVTSDAAPTASPPRPDGDQGRPDGEARDKDTGPPEVGITIEPTEQSQVCLDVLLIGCYSCYCVPPTPWPAVFARRHRWV